MLSLMGRKKFRKTPLGEEEELLQLSTQTVSTSTRASHMAAAKDSTSAHAKTQTQSQSQHSAAARKSEAAAAAKSSNSAAALLHQQARQQIAAINDNDGNFGDDLGPDGTIQSVKAANVCFELVLRSCAQRLSTCVYSL